MSPASPPHADPCHYPLPRIIPLYLIYRPANNIPYATMEEDLEGPFERYCVRERDGSLAMRSTSEISQKCCSFQHWLYQWTNGNILVTDMEGNGRGYPPNREEVLAPLCHAPGPRMVSSPGEETSATSWESHPWT